MFEYHSSPIDWCESNFEVSYFIAEFYNTLTTLPMLYVAYLLWTPSQKIYACIVFGIGIGSMIFHSTLNLFGQLFDEFCLVLYVCYLTKCPYFIPICGLIFVYPKINAYVLISTAFFIIVAWYYNVLYLHIPLKTVTGSRLIMQKPLILIVFCVIAGALWIMDIACINGMHLHFIWHIFSSYILYLSCGVSIQLRTK